MQPMIEGFVRQPKGRWFKSTPRNHPNVPRVDRACQQLPFSLTHIMLGTIRFRRHHGRVAHLCAFVFAKVGSRGLMQRRASFSSSLVPTEIQDLVASAECTNPKRDRL